MADLVNRARVHLCAIAHLLHDERLIHSDTVDRFIAKVERMSADDLLGVLDRIVDRSEQKRRQRASDAQVERQIRLAKRAQREIEAGKIR